MLTFHDCVGMCEFSTDEIKAIARHEHISGMAALILAEELIHQPGGAVRIQRMILDNLAVARSACDTAETVRLEGALHHFAVTHAAQIARRRAD